MHKGCTKVFAQFGSGRVRDTPQNIHPTTMASPVPINHVTYQDFLGLGTQDTVFTHGKPVLLATAVQQVWDAFASAQALIRELQKQIASQQQQIGNLQHQVSGFQEARAAADKSLTGLRDKLRTTHQELERERNTLRQRLQGVTAERDVLQSVQQQQLEPGQQSQQPPQQSPPTPHEVVLGQNQRLENLLTTILNRTTATAPAPTYSVVLGRVRSSDSP